MNTYSARLLGMRHKAEWDTTSLHSNKNFTRREPLETSSTYSLQTHTPSHSPPQPKSSHYAAKHQKSSVASRTSSFVHSFLHPPSILLPHQTAKSSSPAGISKSLQSAQEELPSSKNGPLWISVGGMALRWEEKRGTYCSSSYSVFLSLLRGLQTSSSTLESGIPTYLTLPRGS